MNMSVMDSKYVPWDEPWEWVVWLVLLIVATFVIHNGLRVWKESGRPHP